MPADRLSPQTAAIHIDLTSDGIAVRDRFLPGSGMCALIECAHRRRERGEFGAARVGTGSQRQRREEIRGDSTCWVAEPLFDAERSLTAALEILRLELNRAAFLGLFDQELHYAWYPPGTRYARHVDQPRGRDGRVVSFILYLNAAWQPGDGGELRLFDATGGYRDIEPVGGRLVCFLTQDQEHEVLSTRIDRLSVTGWFRVRDAS